MTPPHIAVTTSLFAALLWSCASSPPKPAAHRTTPAADEHPDQSAEAHHHAEGDHEHGSETSDAAEPAETHQTPQDLLAAESAAYDAARPVFERYCAKCHSSSGTHPQRRDALPHFSIDSYPFGGHHATEMAATIREVLGVTGEEATMPKDDPGAVQGGELALILGWADAFERSHEAGLHEHGEGDHGHGGHSH